MRKPTAAPLSQQSPSGDLVPTDRIQTNIISLCTALRYAVCGDSAEALDQLELVRFSIGIAISDLEQEVARHD